MPQIETEYETAEGIVLHVTADITLGRREVQPSLSGPGEPAEDPVIEIVSVVVKDFQFAEEELEGACWTAFEGEV